MKYLVDANILSEPTRKEPHAGVVGWLRRNEPEIVVDPMILGEIQFGILLLPKSKRRSDSKSGSWKVFGKFIDPVASRNRFVMGSAACPPSPRNRNTRVLQTERA